MGYRTILVTTALWLGIALLLPQTTIAASFVAPSVRPPLSNGNRKKSLRSSSHRSWLVRKQQSNPSQDVSSPRRMFSTRLVLRQSEDGAAETDRDEQRKPSTQVSQFAFQRSLLEARLAMEAAASKDVSTFQVQQDDPEMIAEEKDSSAVQPEGAVDDALDDTGKEEMKNLFEDVLEAINVTEDMRTTAKPPSFASVASEELSLEVPSQFAAAEDKQDNTPNPEIEIEESISTSVSSEVMVSKKPTKGARAVSPPKSRKRKKKEPASQVVEPSSSMTSDEQASVDPSEIFDIEGWQNETTSPVSLITDPIPASVTSAEEASGDPSVIAYAEDTIDEIESPANQVEGPTSSSLNLEEQTLEEPSDIAAADEMQDNSANLASLIEEPASTPVTSEVVVAEEPTKVARAVSPTQSRKRKKKEPASQVVEPSAPISSDETASVKPSEIVDTGDIQEETASPVSLFADPTATSFTSEQGASEKPSTIAVAEDVQDETESPASPIADPISSSLTFEEQVLDETISDAADAHHETERPTSQVAGPTAVSKTLEEQSSEDQLAIAVVTAMQDETANPAIQVTAPTSANITSEILASEEPTNVARAVSPSQSRKRMKEPASQVVELSSASISSEQVASEEPSEIFDVQDEAASPADVIADPTFTSSNSEEKASEEPSVIADVEDTKDEIEGPTTQVGGSTSTSDTFEALASEEPSEEVRAISPPSKPEKRKREPTYWQTLSRDDITSIIVESVTPEKGLRQLNEEADADLLGFAATRLTSGLIEGGKAAFFSVKAAAGDKTEETAVAAASKATQKFVSALAAVTALGFRGAGRAQECAQKLQAERIEAAKMAAEARKAEKEKNRIEAERVAAEKALMDETMAVEKLALKEIQARVEEVQCNVEEESSIADKMAVEKIRASNEMFDQEIREMQVDVAADIEQLSDSPIFFADEI